MQYDLVVLCCTAKPNIEMFFSYLWRSPEVRRKLFAVDKIQDHTFDQISSGFASPKTV